MEKVFIELIGGLILTGIVPVLIIRQLQKGAVFLIGKRFQKKNILSGQSYCSETVIYATTITLISILSVINQNSDMVMGTLIGSVLFQLLGICAVNKLSNVEKQKIYSNSNHYLIFCAILLLFLSADYLLRGETANNVLNQIDGGLLIFLFCIYIYLTYGKEGLSNLQGIQWKETKQNNQESMDKYKKFFTEKIGMHIVLYLFLAIVIVTGNYLLFESVSKAGIYFEISQYCIGLTLMTWCVNLSSILLNWLTQEKNTSIEEYNLQMPQKKEFNLLTSSEEMKKVIENVIFMITLLPGVMVLIKPIMITNYIIQDLIFFGVVSVLLLFTQKIDNYIAGSGMVTVYIGFVVYAFMR